MLFMFPVIDLTTVGTILELIIQIGQTAAELYILNYLVFEGGWLDMLRLISFWLDTLVIKYIDRFYSYFDKILNGKIFDPAVVERVMNDAPKVEIYTVEDVYEADKTARELVVKYANK